MRLSIVIPYYNQGRLLLDALDSTKQIPEGLCEVIIVNDGSTDPETLETLKHLPADKYKIVNQPNMGLGAARNNGIKIAKGEYILPLDSDNKITPEYVTEGIRILDADKNVGVVYGNPIFFGAPGKMRWEAELFDRKSIRLSNYIDACAVYRRSLWESLGGYDEHMPWMGHEDWDFWIRISGTPYTFHHINKPMFYYRVVENSMITNVSSKKLIENFGYIMKKNAHLYAFYPEEYSYTFARIVRLSKWRFRVVRALLKLIS